MSHAAGGHQQHDYRGYNQSSASAKRPPPADGEERELNTSLQFEIASDKPSV